MSTTSSEACVSFKLTKTTQRSKLTTNKAVVVEESGVLDFEEKIAVSTIEDRTLKSDSTDNVVKQKTRLVIPLSSAYDWKTNLLNKKKLNPPAPLDAPEAVSGSGPGDDLSVLARQAILQDAKNFKEVSNSDTFAEPVISTSLDSQSEPDFPSDSIDYESCPIEEYGKAMLRGMGWSEGGAIGLSHKKAVAMSEPQLRPKGLGLGADRRLLEKAQAGPSGENMLENIPSELKMKRGAGVRIASGRHQGLYGKIESFDEDNARVIVKLAIKGEVCSISTYAVDLVTEKDYEKNSKIINRAKYEEYKEKTDRALEAQREAAEPIVGKRSTSRSSNHKRSSPSSRTDSSKKRRPDQEYSSSQYSSNSVLWVRPDIVARIVDKNICNGKYYKVKVKVIDVSSATEISCRTAEGKLLEGVSQAALETVIPKQANALAMVLLGKHRGEVGRVVELNKRDAEATVQLLRRPDKLLPLSYDAISEYIGDTVIDD